MSTCVRITCGWWNSWETRRSASVVPTKTARTISARTHARTPTVTQSLFAREYLFIHQRGARRCFSHAYVSRSRVVSPLPAPSMQQSQFARVNSTRGRRTYACRRESVSREFRGRTRCLRSQALDRSRGSANASILWATARKSEVKCFEGRNPHNGRQRKRPERAVDFCNTCHIATVSK